MLWRKTIKITWSPSKYIFLRFRILWIFLFSKKKKLFSCEQGADPPPPSCVLAIKKKENLKNRKCKTDSQKNWILSQLRKIENNTLLIDLTRSVFKRVRADSVFLLKQTKYCYFWIRNIDSFIIVVVVIKCAKIIMRT